MSIFKNHVVHAACAQQIDRGLHYSSRVLPPGFAERTAAAKAALHHVVSVAWARIPENVGRQMERTGARIAQGTEGTSMWRRRSFAGTSIVRTVCSKNGGLVTVSRADECMTWLRIGEGASRAFP